LTLPGDLGFIITNPVVDRLSPPSGALAAGISATIGGVNLSGVTDVQFGGGRGHQRCAELGDRHHRGFARR
jgi:hypothetical protein